MILANKIITRDEMDKFLSVITNEDDKHLFSICANTGLRVSELCGLKWGDIYPSYLIVQRGKGDKKRTVFFGEKTYQLFLNYKRTKTVSDNDYIFIGQRGRLTRHGVYSKIKKYLNESGVRESLSTHSLRHYYATNSLDNGINLNTVKEQLGHSSISTTGQYLHLTQKSREDIAKIY